MNILGCNIYNHTQYKHSAVGGITLEEGVISYKEFVILQHLEYNALVNISVYICA